MLRIFFIIFFSFFAFLSISQAEASGNVSGWAWSKMDDSSTAATDEGQIGWISFNCANRGVCGVSNYGVNIDNGGVFSGYAWSDAISWINFAPAGPYPAAPNYSAKMDSANGQVSGWARACSVFQSSCSGVLKPESERGGWDGWIKLRGTNYGVSVNKVNGDFSGYAWSDKILGWINFKGTDYKVKTSLNFNSPPSKPSTSEVSWNNCAFKGKAVPTFSWTYSDPDSDPQAAYEIEVDDNSGFNSPKFNHLVNSPSTSYVLDLSQDDDLPDPGGDWISELTWNTTYFWHVRVKDNQGNWSEWSNSSQLKTNKHASPWVVFSYTPTEPTTGETVEFDSSGTESFGGALSYLWTILSGTGVFVDGTNNAVPSPHVRFSTLNNTVRLEATDSDGYACSKDKDVIVQYPLPEYKEVPPVIWFKKIFASVGNLINSFWQ